MVAGQDIRLKRIYDPPEAGDGARVLVDRLWPRGISKERAALTAWLRDVAPSHELRRWFGHEPSRWPAFREKYRAELEQQPDALAALRDLARRGPLTLLFAARDEAHNEAVVLREVLLERGHAQRAAATANDDAAAPHAQQRRPADHRTAAAPGASARRTSKAPRRD